MTGGFSRTVHALVGLPVGQGRKEMMAYYSADFVEWWHNTGSGIGPEKNDDMESHAHRVAHAAWDAACLSTIMLLGKEGSEHAHKATTNASGQAGHDSATPASDGNNGD
jgi:hypothetical protein